MLGHYPLDLVRRIASGLEMRLDITARWQGGELDRILNQAHADLHGSVARSFELLPAWAIVPEVSFSIYGERGVIDVLGWHAASRSLLIMELKTELVDPQDMISTMDRRKRLGKQIAREQGWSPLTVSVWVVFSDSRTNHRRVLRYASLLRAAFPSDGHAIRSWLVHPVGVVSVLSFWSIQPDSVVGRPATPPKRVRTHARPAS